MSTDDAYRRPAHGAPATPPAKRARRAASIVAHFHDHGIELREIVHSRHPSDVIELRFEVGPDFDHEVGFTGLDASVSQWEDLPPRVRACTVPSCFKGDLVLWRWNGGKATATEGYCALFDRLVAALQLYESRDQTSAGV